MPDGPRVLTYDTIGSTNEEALTRARNGEKGPLWITARRQEAGRGRRGRVWVSEPGNLYASLLLSDPAPPAMAPQLSFVAALAARDALVANAPRLDGRVAFKWPNDLLLDDAKCGGILIEAEGAQAVAIGIGINCRHHPADVSYPATDLKAAGVAMEPGDLFHSLAAAMTRRLAQWDRGAGFAAIRADWLAHAAHRGQRLAIRTGATDLDGRFETLDESGRLLLRDACGHLHAITAGEVLAQRPRAEAES